MAKKRLLYVLRQYPQITESYMETEITALWDKYDIEIIALNTATEPRRRAHPYRHVPQDDEDMVARAVLEFAPDIVHGHELDNTRRLSEAARVAGVGFTLRAHSYDVLGLPRERLERAAELVNDDRCLGILAFPFSPDILREYGFDEDKIHPCRPVLNFDLFHDESPNGAGIMNIGACQPKKGMDDFVRLAARMKGKTFDLYAVGFSIGEIRDLNYRLGQPVNLMPQLEHDEMPAEYKKHQWLVYTAADRTVGWPVAVAEAQASGVGVCMQNVRPDVREYVGDAGFVFDTIDEVVEIISEPVPDDVRRRGFEQARKSDVRGHIGILESLWNGTRPSSREEAQLAEATPR